jgi:hypothetical protein
MSERLMTALGEVRTLPVISLGNIVDRIQEEALLVLCLISILPFMQPIPIPGLSSVLGLIAFLQGVGLLLWSKPILTHRLKKVNISHERFEHIYKAASKFCSFTQKISICKATQVNSRFSHILCGFSIILSAGFLSLPLPIPFSNFIPALSIFFICIGLLENDLMLVLLGHGITATVIWMAIFSYHLIIDHVSNWFF